MSDLQSKKEFLDTVQKKLAHACMQLCFEQTHVKQACIDKCFTKFVSTINTVADQMIESGRQVGSEYPRRLRRDDSLYTDIIYSDLSVPYKFANPSEAQAKDRAANKSR